MKTSTADFDLIITEKHCSIVANDVALLLPITMTLEECIEICCEKNGAEFIEIVKIYDRDEDGWDGDGWGVEGKYSYVH